MDSDFSQRLIEALRNPAAYRHPVTTVDLLETHISWVLLTADFAYKIKKPVNLGFCDFTSLQKREFFCREEIRLNRRLAAELYLDVVPITGTPDSPRVGGDGTPIEFAVRMKQFPQDALLSHMMERSQLDSEHVDALAEEVAEFHRSVEVTPPDSRFGTPEQVGQPVWENFRHLTVRGRDASQQEIISTLDEWSRREFDQLEPILAERKRGGFVRECHGDMHLGNMLLWNNRVTIFDCIEFNENLRWIDVLSEAAFVVMDLYDRGRPDLARRFQNAYLEITGDFGGLRVLPFYLTYRALVRAKVARLRLDQAGLGREEQTRQHEEFQSYLHLAERFIQPQRAALIITCGLSGSGKSTGAQRLVEELGAVCIRSDVERKRLLGLGRFDQTTAAAGSEAYSEQMTDNTYARLAELAQSIVAAGYPVVVDATFLARRQRHVFRALAKELDVPFALVAFQAPDETLRERIRQRSRKGRVVSEADVAVFDQQRQKLEPFDDEELPHVITVDVTGPGWLEPLSGRVIAGLASK